MLLAKIHYRPTKSTAWYQKKLSLLPTQIGGSRDDKHEGHCLERNGVAVVV
jgi:hypothetical protein